MNEQDKGDLISLVVWNRPHQVFSGPLKVTLRWTFLVEHSTNITILVADQFKSNVFSIPVYFLTESEDSYYTVIIKEINAFNWVLRAHKSSSKLKWVMKLDDDVILNIHRLQTLLKSHEEDVDKNRILCREIRARPIRKPSSKW